MRVALFIVVLLGFAQSMYAQQDPVCPAYEAVMTSDTCSDVMVNGACIVSGAPDASLRDEADFSGVGMSALLNSIEAISLQPGDVIRLRLSADLSNAPAVDAFAFGGVTLTNLVPKNETLNAQTVDRARVRSTPDTLSDANIVTVLPAGTPVIAAGRTEGGDWIQIGYGEGLYGWTADFLLRISGDVFSLPIGESTAPVLSPMQSFTLSADTFVSGCEDSIPPGLLLHSANSNTRLVIGGIQVAFDGVLFVQPVQQVGRPGLRFEVYLGRAVLQTERGVAFVVPGSASTVVVAPDWQTPLDSPLSPQPANNRYRQLLTPFAALLASDGDIVLAEPAVGAQMDALMLALFAPDGLLPGRYRITASIIDAPVPLAGFECALGSDAVTAQAWDELVLPEVGTTRAFTPDSGDALREAYQVEIMPGVRVNGAALNEHNNPRYRTIPDADGEVAARTIVVNSLTSFTYIESWARRAGTRSAACYNQFTWEWVSP